MLRLHSGYIDHTVKTQKVSVKEFLLSMEQEKVDFWGPLFVVWVFSLAMDFEAIAENALPLSRSFYFSFVLPHMTRLRGSRREPSAETINKVRRHIFAASYIISFIIIIPYNNLLLSGFPALTHQPFSLPSFLRIHGQFSS